MRMAYSDYVVCDDGLRHLVLDGKKVGFTCDLRLNYYRGLEVSCIEEFILKIDGVVVPNEIMLFHINGKAFHIDELPDLWAEFWAVKTRATLECDQWPLADGEHHVELTMTMRSPYMQYGPGDYTKIDASGEKTLTIRD